MASVAKKTGKKFVIDPRVRADVTLVGEDLSGVSCSECLTILGVHGFVALEGEDYVSVVPDAVARRLPVPLLSPKNREPAFIPRA